MNRSQIADKLKGQIGQFSGKLSEGLPKVAGRFVEEMLYGILCRQSVRVSEIGRALNQRIRLIKTVNRLCRQLGRCGLEERVTENLMEQAAPRIEKDTLLIVDPSDLSKKYAKKMEYVATSCSMPYRERIIREEGSREKVYNIQVGFRALRLPGREERLAMVVVKGLGREPPMILTNVQVVKSRKSLMFVVLSYFRRWQIEETIRFAKQAYDIEDIRLRRYDRLQNMIAIVSAAVYFVAVWLGERLKLGILAHHALQAAKRIFGVPDFRYYALADGVEAFLAGSEAPFRGGKAQPRADPQLMLPI